MLKIIIKSMEPLGKITAKNSWQTNLIQQLEEDTAKTKNINFNKATETLDGSIRIFSVRLDDLTNDTQKILTKVIADKTELKEKEKHKRKKRESHLERGKNSFLEKKVNCIFKGKLEKLYRIFKEGKFIVESNEGYSENKINLFEETNEIFSAVQINSPEIIDFSNSITPSLFKNVDFSATNTKNIEVFNNDEMEEMDFEKMEDEIVAEVEREFEEVEDGEITGDHMIYSRGFAGPNFWKMKTRSIRLKEKKKREPKQKSKIDFFAPYDFNKIYEQGNIFISSEILNSRKKNSYQLPDEFLISQKDIFSLNYLNGFFNEKNLGRNSDFTGGGERTFSFYQDNNEISNFIPPIENEDEIVNNITIGENEMATILHQRYKRKQKNVDMQFLKQNIYENIVRGEKDELSFKNIIDCMKPLYLNKRRENLTDHFCFISLLHLANENNLNLINENDDIKIYTN